MGQLDEILLECLTITKNSSFYRQKWAKPSDRCVKLHQRSRLKRLKVKRYEYIMAIRSWMDAPDQSSRRAL